MNIILTQTEKTDLEVRHKKERDRRVADRIKAVLLCSEGWTQLAISQALRIRPETVHDHLEDYKNSEKLKPENGGSESYLTADQSAELIAHIESSTYLRAADICVYVWDKYHIKLSESGMKKWLYRQKFSYKKPKGVPAKADKAQQKEFIEFYEKLMNTLPEDEPVEFGDGVHPTMATKVTYGWIRKGQTKTIPTTASRTRMNLVGSINLETMGVTIKDYETINSGAMEGHFEQLRQKYPKAPKIHLILDNGSYNKSHETKEAAKKCGIVLYYLPPYSPNLNPIERLWKVMNEHARNNRFFRSAKEFREAILEFFEKTWPAIAKSMVDRINDNFETLSA
jgi:transposase